MVDPAHMNWKYYEPRQDWPGSRSYVLEEGGRIVAHLALCPGRLLTTAGPITCTHFIDWAADPGATLAGAKILQKITRLVDLTLCVGGSPDNKRLLPAFGFKPANEVSIFARPLRPFRQIRTHQYSNWKLPVRLVRNTAWKMCAPLKPGKWKATVASPGEIPEILWNVPGAGGVPRERSAALYSYMLRSPAPRFALFLLRYAERPAGCACLCFASGQARIVDIWVDRPSRQALAGAYAAAIEAALATDSSVAEAVLSISTAVQAEAARLCGFRFIRRQDMMMYPGNSIPATPLEAPLIVDDAAFLRSRRAWYLT
jgi:hypothetical protein